MDQAASSNISPAARWSAAAIALVSGGSVVLQLTLNTLETGALLGALWAMAIYFTILTNFALAAVMGAVAIGRYLPRALVLSMVTAIVIVGAVFHTVLSHLVDPQGWGVLANQGVHTAAPLMSAAWWIAFATGDVQGWRKLGWVILWPMAYTAYALVRGAVTGAYPYPFMDLPAIGWGMLAFNLVMLSLAFLAVGALLHGAVQWRARHRADAPQPRRSTI